MTKYRQHTLGTRVSDDPTDPTIYPDKSWEETECEHGVHNKSDCHMCSEEKITADRIKVEEEAKRKVDEEEL